MRSRHGLAALALLLSLLGTLLPTGPAAAQVDGLPVKVYACDADVPIPGSASGAPLPPECRRLAGVEVTAYGDDGLELASCVTGASGGCWLDVVNNGVRVYVQDESMLPDGYAPRSDVVRLPTYSEFAEVVFVNYRDGVLPEPASDGATLRVHSRICPWGYAGDDFYADCHDSLPPRSHWIFAGEAHAATGTDGNAVLRDLPAGETTVVAGQNAETGDVFFYCSETADPAVRREAISRVSIWYDDVRRMAGSLTLKPNDDVTCDWYVIPGLDRGLWSAIEHWDDSADPATVYYGGMGELRLEIYRCPYGYDAPNPTRECVEPVAYARVRAVASDGRQFDVAPANADGVAILSLAGAAVGEDWIVMDGRASIERDQFWCWSTGTPERIAQTVEREADRWRVGTLGDDPLGVTCAWYLAPPD